MHAPGATTLMYGSVVKVLVLNSKMLYRVHCHTTPYHTVPDCRFDSGTQALPK